MQTHIFRTLSALALAALVGGCSDPTACSIDSDCFEAEVCSDGSCQLPGPSVVSDMGAGTGDMSAAADDGTSDVGESTEDLGAADMGLSEDVGHSNEDLGQGDASTTEGLCRADPFASCPADDDDRFAEQITNVGFGRGCVRVDDDFDGGTVTLQGRTICPREEVDKYSIGVNPCDTKSFIVEVTVTPAEACSVDDWELNARIGTLDCRSPDVQCTDDGRSKTTTFIVRPDDSVLSLNIDVLPVAENLRFDYELEITFRE